MNKFVPAALTSLLIMFNAAFVNIQPAYSENKTSKINKTSEKKTNKEITSKAKVQK